VNLNDINSLEETAAYLKIDNPDILRRMARAKKIGFIKQGAKYVFPRDVVLTYIEKNTVTQTMPHPSGMTESSLKRLRASA